MAVGETEKNIDWDERPEESVQAVEDALHKVRAKANKVKAKRRAVAGSTITAIFLVAVIIPLSLDHTKKTTSLAQPPSTQGPSVTQIKTLLASDVIAKVDEAESSMHAISGTTTQQIFADPATGTTASTSTIDFRQNSSGDFWERNHGSDGTTSEHSYIASTGTLESCCSGPNTPSKTTNAQDLDPLEQSFYATPLAMIRQLSNDNYEQSVTLANTSYDSQPAWELSLKNVSNGGLYDSYDITVVQQTSIPVDVKAYAKGRLDEEDKVANLQINPTLTPADFSVTFPANAKVSTNDDGYIHTTIENVNSIVGYKAFAPQYLPSGFQLSTVTATKGSDQQGINVEGSFVPIKDEVDLVYRKGLQRITVTTVSSDNMSASHWGDPLGGEDGIGFSMPDKPFSIKGGAFNGIVAHTNVGLNGPDMWAVGTHYVLSVSGDANYDDMAKIVGSLQQQ